MAEDQGNSEQAQCVAAAKQLCALQRHAALATHSHTCKGFPFGSVVPYDIEQDGSFLIFVARISQHFQNLKADPRASLLICDPAGSEDPQAHARLTVLCEFHEISEAERDPSAARYFKRFPESQAYELQHSFVFMRGRPERLRWIGGFGEIYWLDCEIFSASLLDPLAYEGAAIIDHMNRDHQEALQLYLRAFCGQAFAAPRMCSLCSSGFELRAQAKNFTYAVSIPFLEKLSSAPEARQASIKLLALARQILAER